MYSVQMYGVLILSDDSNFLSQAKRFIPNIDNKVRVETLNNPSRLREVLKSPLKIDVIVCDHNPPGMDAFSIFNEMNRMNDLRPFMIATRTADGEVALKASDVRMDYYLVRENGINFFMNMVPKIVLCAERVRSEEFREINERRTDALVALMMMRDRDFSEILDFALEKSVSLTDSTIGYIAMYDESENKLRMAAWSRGGMEQCDIKSRQVDYDFDATGVWGEPVRQGNPIIINNYQDEKNYTKSGTPLGHVKLNRLLMIPIYHNGKILATAGLGNKATKYNSEDLMQFTMFMNGLISIYHERMLEDKTEEDKKNIDILFNNIPLGLIILDSDLSVVVKNSYARFLAPLNKIEESGNSLRNNNDDLSIKLVKKVEKVKDSGRPLEFEHIFETNGKNAVYKFNIAENENNEESEFIIAIDDISESVEKNRRKISTMERINQLNRLVDTEIGNILSKIKDNLKNDSDFDKKSILDKVDLLQKTVSFSEKYHNIGSSEPIWQSLEDMLKKAAEESCTDEEHFEYKAKGVKVLADSEFYIVFTQLIEFSRLNSDGIPSISVRCELIDGSLVIIYSDSGKGIPDEEKEILTDGDIMSLGKEMFLAISILKAEKFEIKEQGVYGKGLEFRIKVPSSNYSVSWD